MSIPAYKLSHPTKVLKGEIVLTASKSESNRALIIQALCEDKFEIKNLAAAEDTATMQRILQEVKKNRGSENEHTYDVGPAGTTMRFLTAYLSTQSGTHIITGSERMKNRPIGILVNALRDLGADIEYLEKEGYPPMCIKGKKLKGGEVSIDGSVSSQYISALLLVSTEFENELTLKFIGEVTSRPYINMTLRMMEQFRIPTQWKDDSIVVNLRKQGKFPEVYTVEGDWSSASYWFAMAAFAKECDITIKGLNSSTQSLQGDSAIVAIFSELGVKAEYTANSYRLTKQKVTATSFEYDFSDCPDIAQTVAVVVGALKIPSVFTGLHTLRIKETDRTAALKNELAKIGVEVEIVSDDRINIYAKKDIQPTDSIATYEDHRMAMAFAPLALMKDSITIEHPDVVKKSYPDFWRDLKNVGFVINDI